MNTEMNSKEVKEILEKIKLDYSWCWERHHRALDIAIATIKKEDLREEWEARENRESKGDELIHVQILNNYYVMKEEGFETLKKEGLAHDTYSNSSWYNLSQEAYDQWLALKEKWQEEKD